MWAEVQVLIDLSSLDVSVEVSESHSYPGLLCKVGKLTRLKLLLHSCLTKWLQYLIVLAIVAVHLAQDQGSCAWASTNREIHHN